MRKRVKRNKLSRFWPANNENEKAIIAATRAEGGLVEIENILTVAYPLG